MSHTDAFPTFRRVGRAVGPVAARGASGIGRGIVWCAKRGWKPLLALILAFAVAHSIATLVLGRRVEAEIDRIRAAGDPVTGTDLAGPRIPASENRAVVYMKAFKRIHAISKDMKAPLGVEYELLPNSFSVIAETAPPDPETWDQARKAVAACAPVFELVNQAADRPKCRYPTQWDQGIAAAFPELSDCRSLARLLAVKALVAARDGKQNEALDACSQLFHLGESLKDEPTVIHQLVRASVLDYSACALQGAVGDGIGEDSARSLLSVLEEIDLDEAFVEAVKGERALLIQLFGDIRTGRIDAKTLLGPDAGNSLLEWRVRACGSYLGRPWLYADELAMLRRVGEEIERFRRPFLEPLQDRTRFAEPSDGPITFMLDPQFQRARERVQSTQAEVYGSRILLGLKAYRSRFGEYPASLADLRPKLNWVTPDDPFSGKGFAYRPMGDGFVLYSVGQNRRDDGGVRIKGNENRHNYGDIVWRLDR